MPSRRGSSRSSSTSRGRYDTHKRHEKPKKDIWLRPLRKDWKQVLNQLKLTLRTGTTERLRGTGMCRQIQ